MSSKRTQPSQDERDASTRLRMDYAGSGGEVRPCAHPGCLEHGEFKAPAGKHDLRDYVWFCLEHVREYNSQWDYFAGMSEDQIESHRRADVTWHRPSWIFGGNNTKQDQGWRDPFQIFEEHGPSQRNPEPPVDGKSREMMRILDLQPGFSEDQLKMQYKQMAKRHHPDLNNGDRRAEERLKRVNEAYSHLKQKFA